MTSALILVLRPSSENRSTHFLAAYYSKWWIFLYIFHVLLLELSVLFDIYNIYNPLQLTNIKKVSFAFCLSKLIAMHLI